MFTLTKEDAIAMFGSKYRLAKELGISRQAVGQWPDKKPIPGAHAYRIRYDLKPEAFEKDSAA